VDLGEDPLRAADHMSCAHVVLCPVPGAHEAALCVDTAACEVGAQVAAFATDSEVFAVVADGLLVDSGNGAFVDVRGGHRMTHGDSFMAGHATVASGSGW